jgi:Ser/Thr protein kinase RdoA (MazF antagonist)
MVTMIPTNDWESLCSLYGWEKATTQLESISVGLINSTYKVITLNNSLILQIVNNQVFKIPSDIDHNINLVSNHLKVHHPNYLFISPITNQYGQTLTILGGKYYRVFPFVPDSRTYTMGQSIQQSFDAAKQFGQFTFNCKQLNNNDLKVIIVDFHQLSNRFKQFKLAVEPADSKRIETAQKWIEYASSMSFLVAIYEAFIQHHDTKKRVTHHDTKISNVLFDKSDNALCIIDLDTIMPGYFLSDLGDMLRTFCCTVSEEESDLEKMAIIPEQVEAVIDGYCTAMANELSPFERSHLHYSGAMMMLMQALRFLTDYLENDRYYGAKYPEHNVVRAANQFRLLELFLAAYSSKMANLMS